MRPNYVPPVFCWNNRLASSGSGHACWHASPPTSGDKGSVPIFDMDTHRLSPMLHLMAALCWGPCSREQTGMHIKLMVFCWVALSPRPQAWRLVERRV